MRVLELKDNLVSRDSLSVGPYDLHDAGNIDGIRCRWALLQDFQVWTAPFPLLYMNSSLRNSFLYVSLSNLKISLVCLLLVNTGICLLLWLTAPESSILRHV